MTTSGPEKGRPVHSDEGMAVRTPEHVELNFLLAGPGNRFLALLVDLVIQWLLLLGIVLALGGILWATKRSVADVFGALPFLYGTAVSSLLALLIAFPAAAAAQPLKVEESIVID